jgi:Peptidase family M1 domain
VGAENWESGRTVFLPEPLKINERLELDLSLEGDFMTNEGFIQNCYYPRSNVTWFPRHGTLDRATFDLTFRHPTKFRVASPGTRTFDDVDPQDSNTFVSKYQLKQPVAFVTFGLRAFKRHQSSIKWDNGDAPTPLEFNELRNDMILLRENVVLAELNNSVRYFARLFGSYPYPVFGAAFHPFAFGQGFPSLLLIPFPPERSTKLIWIYQFIGHETAHQWWGNIVSWRSYRDQWLSEGFAEYSGILYAGARDGQDAKNDLLRRLRSSLKDPPSTTTGLGKGRLVDVGPIILGHRLSTTKTTDAHQALIYNKGALVLRMLHFMLTDPETGDGKLFSAMMTDFVERYRNKTASSDDFRMVVNQHFAKSPLARNHGLTNLNWLFSQFVYQTALPSYELQYKIEDQPDGKAIVTGTVTQTNARRDWIMLLPVQFTFADKQFALGTVLAQGGNTPFQMPLPARPKKVELDPERWILAEGISTKELK